MYQIRFEQFRDEQEGICIDKDDIKRGVMLSGGYAITDAEGRMTQEDGEKICEMIEKKLKYFKDGDWHQEFCLEIAQESADDLGFLFDLIDLENEDCPVDIEEYGKYFVFNERYDVWQVEDSGEQFDYYVYWNGQNHKVLYLELDDKPIEFDGEYYDLNRWDGRNLNCGGSFNHARIYAHEKGYVLNTFSDWQGSLSYATLITTENELKNKLKELDREEELEDILIWRDSQLKEMVI